MEKNKKNRGRGQRLHEMGRWWLPCFRKHKCKIAFFIQVAKPNFGAHHEAMVQQDDGLDVFFLFWVLLWCRFKVGLKLLLMVRAPVPVGISLPGFGGQGHTMFSQQIDNALRRVGCHTI